MAKIVKLICWSNEEHLSQVFAGLTMLHRRGEIRLTQTFLGPPPDTAGPPHLTRVKNWHCRIETQGASYYVDVHDGAEIDAEGLASCDVYLKRGFDESVATHSKIFPFGLNYPVFADGFDRFELARCLRLTGPRGAARYLLTPQPTVSAFESAPATGEPRVLFLCRTWELDPARTAEKNAERQRINEMRAACISQLRTHFGNRCVAGFAPSPYALEHFPAAIVDDPSLTDKRRYLEVVRASSICVASMGLHESNGWKLGEYVAMSRAIVSERLRHVAPEFSAGRNYLEFATPAECVEAVGLLMDSPQKRAEISQENNRYYHRLLRPDHLVATALRRTAAQ